MTPAPLSPTSSAERTATAKKRLLSSWRGWALAALFAALPFLAWAVFAIHFRARVAAARARIPVLEAELRAYGWPLSLGEVEWPDVPAEAEASAWAARLGAIPPRWKESDVEDLAALEALLARLDPRDPAVPVLRELARALEERPHADLRESLSRARDVAGPPADLALAAMRAEIERCAPLLAHALELPELAGVAGEPLLRAALEDPEGWPSFPVFDAIELVFALSARARVALAEGAAEEALEAVEGRLDLLRALRGVPSLQAASARILVLGNACWDLLAAAPQLAGEPGLDELERRLEELDPWSWLRREHGIEALWLRGVLDSSAVYRGVAPRPRGGDLVLLHAWVLEYQLALAAWLARPIAEARAAAASFAAELDELLAGDGAELVRLFAQRPESIQDPVLEVEALRRLALVALAHARGGRAAAEARAAATEDPFGSGALGARTDAGGALVVWSLWRDGADGGGRCAELTLSAEDLVLRLR